jgi:hypothetical protein
MRFKTKDLLVTVLPKAEIGREDLAKICLLHTHICKFPTLCTTPSLCQSPTLCHAPTACAAPTLCHAPTACSPTVCHQPTLCHWPTLCGPCSQFITCACSRSIPCGGNSCGAGGSACDFTDIPIDWTINWVIRDQEELQETLQRLDVLEKEGLPDAIQSREQADELERSLTEALEQVRAAKKNLK